MFEMEIIQILTPILKNKDKGIQSYILGTQINIIRNGWKQLKSSSSSSQSNLQQLLSLPHPYQAQLEQQQTIRIIIEDILLKKEVDIKNKKDACELLDIIYQQGIKFKTINQQQQIIEQLCEQSKSKYKRQQSLESLSYLAINQKNHELIIAGNKIKTEAEYIKKELESERVDSFPFKSSLLLIINLFLFGSQQTQQLIQNSISEESINKLKDNKDNWYYKYKNEIKYLLSSYSDPNTMNELIRIRRVVERRSEEGLIELIKAGLIIRINEIIEKSIKETDGEGKLIIIGEIIKLLVKDNSEVIRMLFEQTNFLQQQIHFLNSISPLQIKAGYLKPLLNLLHNIQIEYQNKLFEMGIIQIMIKILDSQEQDVRKDAIQIINEIIKAELVGIKSGQQHPLHQQFQSDGTIPKLIQIFIYEKDYNILKYIAQTLSYLFKSLPLPPEIRNNVIEELKKYLPDFIELSLLSECADNHNAILSKQFEMKLFSDDSYTLECLNFSLSILKYGSNINKLKVASVIKEEVQQLTNDEHVDELGNKQNIKWNSDQKQQIKSKSKELLPIIISIINDKNNINLISQLVTNIQDSIDKDHKQYLCEVILNFIKVQINELKSGQKHPFHQQFQSDGTIPKLIEILKDEKDKEILKYIAQTLSYLFKSLPLPPEIRNNVIEQLKQNYPPDFIELSLLAECSDNHDAILSNQFEMELFSDDSYILESLNISLSFLKYGSNINKLKVASVIKQKVQQLTNDEYVDQLGNSWKNYWNSDKKQQIKSKSKELLPIIISIIGDKENVNCQWQ